MYMIKIILRLVDSQIFTYEIPFFFLNKKILFALQARWLRSLRCSSLPWLLLKLKDLRTSPQKEPPQRPRPPFFSYSLFGNRGTCRRHQEKNQHPAKVCGRHSYNENKGVGCRANPNHPRTHWLHQKVPETCGFRTVGMKPMVVISLQKFTEHLSLGTQGGGGDWFQDHLL